MSQIHCKLSKFIISCLFLCCYLVPFAGALSVSVIHWRPAAVARFQRQEMNAEADNDALLMVYSVDSRHSFDEVLARLDDVLAASPREGHRRLPTILVANKIDLVRRRVVSFEGLSAPSVVVVST